MTPAGFRPEHISSRSGRGMTFSMEGLPKSIDMLRDIGERGEDMRPAMRVIKEIMEEGHRRQFATGGAFLGDPWPANAPGTLARKAREGVSSLSRPMVRTGDLQESLTGGKGGRSRVTRSSVSVGTSLFYAIFHINPKRKGMPARPPVGINDAQRSLAAAAIERHLMGGL